MPNTAFQPVTVWDLPVRLFHWSLATLVTGALLTGYFAPEWWLSYHVAIGTGVLVLLAFRLVWGFTGSTYARFLSFAFSPPAVKAHIGDVMRGTPKPYLGHNPAGGLMVFALIAILLSLCATGLMALGGQEKQGPLKIIMSYADGTTARVVHRLGSYVLVGMVSLHVIGVFVESCLTKDALLHAMITGRKYRVEPAAKATIHRAKPIASAFIVTFLMVVGGGIYISTQHSPAMGVRTLPIPKIVQSACSECHSSYHPSLLPAAAWAQLLAGLSNHFGEDASIAEDSLQRIRRFLIANAAETWDTKAANMFRRVATDEPLRITQTDYWRQRHSDIAPAIFNSKTVGSRINCSACHRDADTGRFDDQFIEIPQEKNK